MFVDHESHMLTRPLPLPLPTDRNLLRATPSWVLRNQDHGISVMQILFRGCRTLRKKGGRAARVGENRLS